MIEDYLYQPEAEEDESPKKERRRFLKGTFLETWLKRDEDEESDDEAEEEEEVPTSLFVRKFRDFFNGLVGLEPVPKKLKPMVELVNESEMSEDLPEHEEFQLNLETDDEPTEGILVVPHEPGDETIAGGEIVSGIEGKKDEYAAMESNSTEPFVPESTTRTESAAKPIERKVFSAGDVLKKEKEALIKRRINKLQKQNKSLEQEKSEVLKKQKSFEKQLEKQVAEAMALDKMIKGEEQKQKLQEARAEAVATKSDESKEVEKLKEFVTNEAKLNPDVVLDKVESAADRDVPIEDLYERRHEIKGESGLVSDSGQPSIVTSRLPAKSRSYLYPSRSKDLNGSTPRTHVEPAGARLWQKQGMYVQAAKNGFWAALMLIVLVFVIVVIF